MPFGLATASSIRCPLVHDPGLPRERDGVSIPRLPPLAVGIPLPTSLFHALAQFHFGKVDTHGHRRVIGETRGGRVPVALGDDELHGLEPLPALRIVAITHADETVPELREQQLRASLAGLEMQARPHAARPGFAHRRRLLQATMNWSITLAISAQGTSAGLRRTQKLTLSGVTE